MIPLRQHIRPLVNISPSRGRNQPPQLATEFTIIRTPKRKNTVSPAKIQNHNRVIIKNNNIENQRNYSSNPNRGVENGRCANHHQKPGKYYIEIDGQMFSYCQKCSAHLASQGFHVERIQNFATTRATKKRDTGISQIDQFKKVQRQLGIQVLSNPRMKQLRGFLRETQKLKSQFNQNILIFQDIPNHYYEQIQMIQQFYDTIVVFINSLRDQHKALLQSQNKRYCQLAQLMTGELQETNSQLQNILEDIVTNIRDIVTGISEQQYRDSINYYLQKIEFFKGRVQQQKMSFQQVTSVQQPQLKKLLQQLKLSISNILGVNDTSVRENVHHYRQPVIEQIPMLKKINNQYRTQNHPQVRDPFRTLFSQEQHQPQQSPHFKAI